MVTPKPTTPAVPLASQSPAEEHRDAELRKITNLYFTNEKGKFIHEAEYNSTINLNIVSTNLIGSKIKLTVKDKDLTDSDILVKEKEYEITGNLKIIPIPLTASMQETGGDIGYQNLYVDIVVLATSKHLVTVPINVDLKATTYDPITNITKFVVEKSEVGKEDKKGKKGDCFCDRDITEEILKKIAPNASNLNIKKYLDGFNETFKKFKIQSCIRRVHFLAQVIHESGSFKYNEEIGSAKYLAKYDGWHGRGLIQLTLKANYEAFEKAIGEDVSSSVENRNKVTESPYAVYSAGWFWDNRELNLLSDKNDFIYITYKVNGGFNHIDDRLKNIKTGFKVLYDDCVNDTDKNTDYKFSNSKGYKDKKCSFAWGLWHDPLFTKDGCSKNKEEAIIGYQRYVDLTDENDTTTNYYGISKYKNFEDLVITSKKGNKKVKVREAALKRINELKQ